MSWDATPWFVGGGAVHSPEIARLLADAAFGGAEGVIRPGDLKVRALDVPGGAVRVGAGAMSAVSKATGGGQQSYAARNPSDDVVDIAPTGSSGGRVDLIVARIEDPFMPGEPWASPSDPTTAQYVYTRVIPNVSALTTAMPAGQTGIVLARVNIPANTATITDAMITDLRKVARPRLAPATDVIFMTGTGTITTSSYVRLVSSKAIEVPSWATHMIVKGIVSGYNVKNGNAFGELRLVADNGAGTTVTGQATTYDHDLTGTTNPMRGTTLVGIDDIVPNAFRGQTVTFGFHGRRGVGPGYVQLDSGTTLSVDVMFQEIAE